MEETKNENEGKTLFEHIGMDEEKTEKIMNSGKKIMFLLGAGVIIGIIIDTMLETNKFMIVVPLIMSLVLLFKWYNKDKEKKEENITH